MRKYSYNKCLVFRASTQLRSGARIINLQNEIDFSFSDFSAETILKRICGRKNVNISIVGGQRGRGQRQLGSLWGDVEEGLMVSFMQKRAGDKI